MLSSVLHLPHFHKQPQEMSCPILAVKYSKNSQQQPPETARNTLIMAGQPAKHLSAPELWGRRQQTGGEEKGER